MMKIIKDIYECITLFLDIVVPRFITETVLFGYDEEAGEYYIICNEETLKYTDEDIQYEYKATIRGLNFFGTMYFVKIIDIHVEDKTK